MGKTEPALHALSPTATGSKAEFWMPFTANRDFKADPKIVVARRGHVLLERSRRQDHRRVVGAVLRQRRPRPQGDRRRGAPAAARARFRAAVHAWASEELRARRRASPS